jgi:hypothetical protein
VGCWWLTAAGSAGRRPRRAQLCLQVAEGTSNIWTPCGCSVQVTLPGPGPAQIPITEPPAPARAMIVGSPKITPPSPSSSAMLPLRPFFTPSFRWPLCRKRTAVPGRAAPERCARSLRKYVALGLLGFSRAMFHIRRTNSGSPGPSDVEFYLRLSKETGRGTAIRCPSSSRWRRQRLRRLQQVVPTYSHKGSLFLHWIAGESSRLVRADLAILVETRHVSLSDHGHVPAAALAEKEPELFTGIFVQRAKVGRAKCPVCHRQNEAGEWRVGVEEYAGGRFVVRWVHPKCWLTEGVAFSRNTVCPIPCRPYPTIPRGPALHPARQARVF